MNNNPTYVNVAGFAWSGSSAVVDLLKEVQGFWSPDIEFRVIKDPYGLDDLHYNLVNNWDSLNSDMAIRDFLWFMDHLNYKPGKHPLKFGLNYQEFFGSSFMSSVEKFIDDIVDFKYLSNWWFIEMKKSRSTILKDKINCKFFGVDEWKEMKMYFSKPSEEDFNIAAKRFIDGLFVDIANKNDATHIILDQGADPKKYIIESNFFRSSKMIIVDRDPRDIYADLLLGGFLLGNELSVSHDANKYIKWHNAVRSGTDKTYQMNNVIKIQFEDLILDYETSIKKIFDFLEIEDSDHIKKKEFFDPDKSKANIGIWKTALSKEETDIIEQSLPDCLFSM